MAKIKRTFIFLLPVVLITAAIIITPLSIYAADQCDTTISPEGLIHIPVLRYQDTLYTVDMQYHGVSASGIDLSIENVQPTTLDCPVESEVTSLSPFTLKIVSLAMGSDNYDITLSNDPALMKTMPAKSAAIFNEIYESKPFSTKTIFNVSLHVLTSKPNKDVWKGKSECTRDLKAAYPGGTAYATAKGRNVTFTRDATVPPEAPQWIYKVSEGSLSYKAYENYQGMQMLETASSAMLTSDGTIKLGLEPGQTEATGTGTLSFESTGTVTAAGGYCNYSGTAYAEWLYIPSIVFSSSPGTTNDVMRTGKYIELNKLPGGPCDNGVCTNLRTWHCNAGGTSFDIPGVPDFAWLRGDLTCTWSFKYYP